jgi:hypothetical protein
MIADTSRRASGSDLIAGPVAPTVAQSARPGDPVASYPPTSPPLPAAGGLPGMSAPGFGAGACRSA